MSGPIEGYADLYNTERRRARKAHRCDACGQAIHPGDYYQWTRSLFEGYFETVRRCGRCETVYQHLNTLVDGFTCVNPMLDCGLDYMEEWDENPPLEIQAVIFATAEEASALLAGRAS